MKNKLLASVLVLIIAFMAAGCSYTFRSVGIVNVDIPTGHDNGEAFVYVFDTEENAVSGKLRLDEGEFDISEFTYRNEQPAQVSDMTTGSVTLDIRWVTSTPTDGKDDDQRDFWMVALLIDGDQHWTSDVVRKTVRSDGTITGFPLTINDN